MTDQGKPSVCPKCGSPYKAWLKDECVGEHDPWHDDHSSPVPAATTESDTALQGLIAVLRFALDRPNDQTWRPNAERAIKLASAPQPVPAATRHIERIADELAAELCLNTNDMPKVKNLLIDFAKEIQRAAIEPTGF